MAFPIIPLALGGIALVMLSKSKTGAAPGNAQVDLSKLPKTNEGEALKWYATAMQSGYQDLGGLEHCAQQIEKLGVRPDLVAAIRAKKAKIIASIGP